MVFRVRGQRHPADVFAANPQNAPPQPFPATQISDPLNGWDYAGIAAGILLTLTITCLLTRNRIFWEDEMLGWMLLRDPSWNHMVQAWKMGADGGGFSFYLLGRAWFQLAGSSALAFRLYSSLCFALAFAVTWIAARRFYNVGTVAFALFNTFFFSLTFVLHMREGRFYGLLVLSVALAFWLALRLSSLSDPLPARWYVASFLIHGLLTTCHLLGILFSAFLLGGMFLLDRLEGRWRPGIYAATAASWLLLWPERANIAASARVGKPHFWIKAPGMSDILGAYTGVSHEIASVLLVLLCLAGWNFSRSTPGLKASLGQAFGERRPVYIFAGALLLIPVALVLEGLVGPWLFHERYLLPTLLGVVYVTAEALHLVRPHPLPAFLQQRPRDTYVLSRAGLCGYVLLLVFWVFHHVVEFTPSQLDYTPALTALLPKGVPVICEDAFTFTELIGRQHASGVRYMFLLDWNQSISPSAPALEVTQYHLMELWRNVGYFSGSIEPIQSFLARNDRFYVVHAEPIKPSPDPPGIGNPLAARFGHDSQYEVRKYAELDRKLVRDTVWLVCRHGCGTATSAIAFEPKRDAQ